jgi:hypothetical protein
MRYLILIDLPRQVFSDSVCRNWGTSQSQALPDSIIQQAQAAVQRFLTGGEMMVVMMMVIRMMMVMIVTIVRLVSHPQ